MMLTLDPGVVEGEERGSGSGGGDSSADIQRAAQGPRPDTVSGQLCLFWNWIQTICHEKQQILKNSIKNGEMQWRKTFFKTDDYNFLLCNLIYNVLI